MRFDEFSIKGNNEVKMFHSTVPSGKRTYFGHHHTECEISIIISGTGTYKVNNKEYDFKKDDIFIFGSNENHCITNIGDSDSFNILNIHFEPRMLWSYSGFGNSKLLSIFHSRTDKFTNKIDLNNPATELIRKLILETESEFKNHKPEYELIIKMNIVNILVNLIRNYDYVNLENKQVNYKNTFEQLKLALDYIDSHIESKITLDDLSRISTMNKTYFSTVFKKYNGISPWDYIMIKRIEKSIRLIKSTDMSKLDIASQCGFNSASNFYKAFQRITGKTPSDYKK